MCELRLALPYHDPLDDILGPNEKVHLTNFEFQTILRKISSNDAFWHQEKIDQFQEILYIYLYNKMFEKKTDEQKKRKSAD